MAEPIELPFGMVTGFGSKNRVWAFRLELPANMFEQLSMMAMSGSAIRSDNEALTYYTGQSCSMIYIQIQLYRGDFACCSDCHSYDYMCMFGFAVLLG